MTGRMGAWGRAFRALACVIVAVAFCAQSQAGTLEVWDVDNSSALSGYVTQDVIFNTETDWLSAEILVVVESGSIYQDPAGGNTPPDSRIFSLAPSLEFDTYLSSSTSITTIGGATSLGGPSELIFDETVLNATWFGLSNADIGAIRLARVTLSDDAVGVWVLKAYSIGGDSLIGGTIENGLLLLDEQSGSDPDSTTDPDSNSDPNSSSGGSSGGSSGTSPPPWVQDLINSVIGGSGGSGGFPLGLLGELSPTGRSTTAANAGDWGNSKIGSANAWGDFQARRRKQLQGKYGKDPWVEFRARRMKQRVGEYGFRLKSIPTN